MCVDSKKAQWIVKRHSDNRIWLHLEKEEDSDTYHYYLMDELGGPYAE